MSTHGGARTRYHGACYWCRSLGPLTRDHVVPRVAGGGGGDNLVLACPTCQFERGEIAACYGRAHTFRTRTIPRWSEWAGKRVDILRQLHADFLSDRGRIAALVAKWRAIEMERWGSSPSAELDLTIPPLPPRRKS